MSVLNQMLRDLEKRGAMPDVVAAAGTATVARPVLPITKDAPKFSRRWLWIAVLAIAAAFVGVNGLLTYRVEKAGTAPSPLGAHQFSAVATAPATPAQPPAAPAPAAPGPVAAAPTSPAPAVVAPPAAAQPPASAPVATTPPAEAAAPVAAQKTPKVLAAPRTTRSNGRPHGTIVIPPQSAPTAVDTPVASDPDPAPVAVVRSSSDVARDVDRAADLIARGRANDAIELLVQVLNRQPTHAAARSSLAALLGEAGRREQALRVLLDGSELDAGKFAMPAAQLQTELGDLNGALTTLARVPAARRNPAYEALYAGVAQRAGDHMSAIAAYRRALLQPQPDPVWWVGLGVSLEATGEPAQARDAYARAAAEAKLPAEVRRYVAERISVLDGQSRRSDDARRASLANVF